MTKDEVIRQLILSNLDKTFHNGTENFLFNWKWTRLYYDVNSNKDKSVEQMIDWFFEKIMMLSVAKESTENESLI